MIDHPHGSQLILRRMTLADLDQVEAIDQISFTTPWPKAAFKYELTQNKNARCWVAVWFQPGHPSLLVAVLVMWQVMDQAHIATLAVRPGYRQRGIAQQLLVRALQESAQSGATHALLEVRESNQAALNLYEKFGFEVVGRRPKYYQDTREDALLMTLVDLNLEKLAELDQAG